jgi:hypothetical protein
MIFRSMMPESARFRLSTAFGAIFACAVSIMMVFLFHYEANAVERINGAVKSQTRGNPNSGQNQITALGCNPPRTWVFAVGVLNFASSSTASWSTRNRRDTKLVSLLEARGVPKSHVVYISDEDATLAAIQQQFKALLDQTQKDDCLICYYTGHGSDKSFLTYDGRSWYHGWIQKQINLRFRGSQIVFLGDCCESGGLEKLVATSSNTIACACLTSSASDESGNGRWTFTQSLLEGLRGAPAADLDHNGFITFDELGAYVRKQIRIYESNHSVFSKNAAFDGNVIIAKTAARKGPEPEPVKVLYKGQWWKAKKVDEDGGYARIRWIDLGYDSPEQDAWIALRNVRPISSPIDTQN